MMRVSILLLQFFAKQRVERAHYKKGDDCSYQNQVTHTPKFECGLMRQLIKPRTKCVKKSLTWTANVSAAYT